MTQKTSNRKTPASRPPAPPFTTSSDPAFDAPDLADLARLVAEKSIALWRAARRAAGDLRTLQDQPRPAR